MSKANLIRTIFAVVWLMIVGVAFIVVLWNRFDRTIYGPLPLLVILTMVTTGWAVGHLIIVYADGDLDRIGEIVEDE